jgi:hypothetical protein
VVVRPDGHVAAPGNVATPIDQPLLVALAWAFYWQQLLDDGVVGSGWACCGSSEIRCQRTGWRSGRWWRGLMRE